MKTFHKQNEFLPKRFCFLEGPRGPEEMQAVSGIEVQDPRLAQIAAETRKQVEQLEQKGPVEKVNKIAGEALRTVAELPKHAVARLMDQEVPPQEVPTKQRILLELAKNSLDPSQFNSELKKAVSDNRTKVFDGTRFALAA